VRRIARDSAVLMGASASWYGVQAAAQWARGGADDAANTAVAGAVSAAFLGAKLFGDAARGRAALRVGLWAAAGAWMGRAAWEDRQRVQQLLLKRQQELEQSEGGGGNWGKRRPMPRGCLAVGAGQRHQLRARPSCVRGRPGRAGPPQRHSAASRLLSAQ
jgi:hypothetical protein